MRAIKIISKLLLFIVLLFLLTTEIYKVLSWKKTQGIDNLYKNGKGADVLFIGSSHSYCTINTAVLWKEYGIAAVDISDGQQPVTINVNYLKEALKIYHPKVVCVELRGLDLVLRVSDGLIYRNTLNMRWSANYIDNLNNAIDNLSKKDAEEAHVDINELRKAILLKFPVVHTRYREITESDFGYNPPNLRYESNWSIKSYPLPEAYGEKRIGKLTDVQLDALNDLVSLSRDNDFRLVLWVAPYYYSTEKAKLYNAVEKYAEEKGVSFYNYFKLIEETDFDYSTDMRKESLYGSHLNNYGSNKITKHMGQQLSTYYNLMDRRNDPHYSNYNQMAREWDVECAIHNLDNAKNIQDYTSAYDNTLFEATVISFNSGKTVNTKPDTATTDQNTDVEGQNLIQATENVDSWYTFHPEYITYPEPGTIMLSASGLKETAYTRAEGSISAETADIMDGNEYVLSFEVMSPDWSAVYEPKTDHKGLDAVAVDFITADDSPYGKQKAYKGIRLGRTNSSLWREIPAEQNGEWLEYVSVPLKFTPTKDTWSDFSKGIGKYLRVGPQLRANGTVYFRNFRFVRCDKTNDWAATIQHMTERIVDKESVQKGLYTYSSRNKINGAWELTDQVRLLVDENNPQLITLYNNSNEIKIKECDLCIIIVDKENGNFIRKNEFTLSKGIVAKQ